ncbi:MAG: CPBP family intramembrane metalloprotease [Coriobacteriaceae bacterium]|nr:CPBP family intramembrane metalloprotease [Coriobacteriaceae bacterium]MCI6845232.1 CPBP family intramembrane metalloprotease [Coriobacteriaceae bacterium]MDD7584657.1 CPBP family intramembrane metalloprotease [Coriobacteriaceae bacterium]
MTKSRLFSLFICLLLVFTNPLLDEILFSIGSQMPFLQDGFSTNVYYVDAAITLLSLVLYLLLWKRFLRGRPLPCSLELSKKRIGASILCSLGLSGISFLILLFVEHVLVPMGILTEAYEGFTTMWNDAEEAGYFWVCLTTVVIGPIFEEVLMRGLVYSVAEREFGGYTPAIMSGILFGLWHGQPVQMLYTAVVGVVLGLVYMKTRNLLYPILIHMLINLYSTLPPGLDTDFTSGFLDFLSLVAIVPTLYVLIKLLRTEEANEQDAEKELP